MPPCVLPSQAFFQTGSQLTGPGGKAISMTIGIQASSTSPQTLFKNVSKKQKTEVALFGRPCSRPLSKQAIIQSETT